MQFDRRSAHNSLHDNSRLRVEEEPVAKVTRNNSSFLFSNDKEQILKKGAVVEDEPKGKWTKVNGKWALVKTFDLSKEKAQDEVAKPAVNTPKPKAPFAIPPNAIQTTAPILLQKISQQRRNDSCIQIQRIVRGYQQRLRFRLVQLQHRLDGMEQRTAQDLEAIQSEIQVRKHKFKCKLELKSRHSNNKKEDLSVTLALAKQDIEDLRVENKHLRQEQEHWQADLAKMRQRSQQLQNTSELYQKNQQLLQTQYQQMQNAHDQLNAVIPSYKKAVETLADESELRYQYILTEQQVKIKYMKVVGRTVELVQDTLTDKQDKLVDEVEGYILALDDNDNE